MVSKKTPIWLPFLITFLLTGSLLLLFLALAYAAEVPATAVLISTQELSCGGSVLLYDTDKDPSNGFEFMEVRTGGRSLAVVEFEEGDGGDFKTAMVTIPGRPAEHFNSRAALVGKYPHPCDIVKAAGVQT